MQVDVTHLPATHGTSSLRLLKLVRFNAAGLAELLAFRFRVGRAPSQP